MQLPRLVVAGNGSGAGKTTVAVGLMAALRARGLRVQPFKCGPDYIDPAYLRLAAGENCRSIDTWLVNRPTIIDLVAKACHGESLALIEGIMGLYDGRSSLGAEGSTAELAKWLRAPVLLVLDVGRTAQSAGAIALGFRDFDPEVEIIGVVLNNITSPAHLARATEGVEVGAGLPVLGHLSYNPGLTLPEQHPSFLPSAACESLADTMERIRREVQATIDVQALLQAMREAWPLPDSTVGGAFPPSPRPPRARVAVLRDEAFDLYQDDNLELLAAWGGELVTASPLHDTQLPAGLDGVYAGPGLPELHAAELAANQPFLSSLREQVKAGLPIYGECGGAVYLSQGVIDQDGERYPFLGVAPRWAEMRRSSPRLGYAVATAARDSLLARRGRHLRAYEFHWALTTFPVEDAAYLVSDPEEQLEGYARGNVLASQLRLHFASDHTLARRFVDQCASRRGHED
ncbi:MAG: cobyrinate a,c-diamide synthase [Chloroflexi bacterium]|nr:cobyrinate a,c-diamide synthase [Chloroflexota bacterium]MCL5107951.1 cobyrinate a,c-diamide synthase [Chloroflexota bacterium]